MRADWAISRPSVWVMLFTGILCTTKFDHLCTCNCEKKYLFPMFETSCGFGDGMSVHPKKKKLQYNI